MSTQETLRLSLNQKNPETHLEKIDRLKEEGKNFNKYFEEPRDEQERFYAGEQWKEKNTKNRPKNHVFQIVESEIPLLMDPMPSTDVAAHDTENFGDQAMVLEAAKDHIYRQQNLFLKDAQMIRQALKTGSGYQYVDFDPDGENGEGSITVKNLSRKQVIKDPSADTLDQCRYIIIDTPLSNDDLRRRFPKTAEEACGQSAKDIFVFAGTKGSREDRNTDSESSQKANRYDSKDMTFVEECWLKDYSMEEIPDDETQIQLTEESVQLMQGINPDISKWEDHPAHISGHQDQIKIIISEYMNQSAAQNPQEMLPGQLAPMAMTPEQVTEEMIKELMNDEQIGLLIQIAMDHIEMHGLYIESQDDDEVGKRPKYPNNLRLTIKTGKIIHFDGAPAVPDGLVPLVELECYKDEGPADGIIKHIIPMQKTLNELDEKEKKGLFLNTNGGWLVDIQSGVDADTLTDEEGIVVNKEQGTEVQRLPGGQVSPQLENRIRREYEAMQRIEGTGETVFGEAPKHQASGVMYRRMQQQSLGRIRLKSKMVDTAIYRRDLLLISRIMKYWSTERKLRTDDENGEVRFVKFDPRMMKDFTYELILSPGTASGMDNETVAETYKELLQLGHIDIKTYAQLTNLPKKTELLKILSGNDQVAAQAQELQAQNQELQKQMLMMKANLAPQTLTPEEGKMVEQFALEEQQQLLTQNPMAVG